MLTYVLGDERLVDQTNIFESVATSTWFLFCFFLVF